MRATWTSPGPSIDADRLTDKVGQVCGRLAAEILAVMDKQPHDVGYGTMLAELPFGGWESLPLDHYSQAATENRDNVSLMRTLLTGVVAERDIALIADDWTTRGAPSHVPERLKAVLANPDTWRSLFVHSEARERDDDRLRHRGIDPRPRVGEGSTPSEAETPAGTLSRTPSGRTLAGSRTCAHGRQPGATAGRLAGSIPRARRHDGARTVDQSAHALDLPFQRHRGQYADLPGHHAGAPVRPDGKGEHLMREYDDIRGHDAAIEMVRLWVNERRRPDVDDIRRLHRILLVAPYRKVSDTDPEHSYLVTPANTRIARTT